MKKQTLERRIAAALTDAITSTDLAQLIVEVEVGITAADAAVEQTRAQALDPIATVDVNEVSAALTAAELARDRLKAALPELQQRLKAAEAQEYLARWRAEYERLKLGRDELAEGFAQLYPEVVNQLVDLLVRVRAFDEELHCLHMARPTGVAEHLYGPEQTARELAGLNDAPSVTRDLKLPSWEQPTALAWPPRTVPLGVQLAAGMGMAGAYVSPEQRAAAGRAENERLAKYYEDLNRKQREREDREAAEAKAEQRRQLEERNRAAGWPT